MNKYKRLSLAEREEISRMLAQKYSFQSIAKSLRRNVSTISREVGLVAVINTHTEPLRRTLGQIGIVVKESLVNMS